MVSRQMRSPFLQALVQILKAVPQELVSASHSTSPQESRAQKLAEIGGADLVSVNTSQPSEAVQRKLALLVKDHMSDAETVATFVADGGTVDTAKMENVFKCVGYDVSTAQTLASSYSGLSADAARQKLIQDEDWLGPFANCAK